MATINLQRSSAYNDRMRDYKVFIDGQQVGTISNGQHKTFTTTPGPHTVTVKIDWCGSPDLSIEISDQEIKKLKTGGFKNGSRVMPVSFAIVAIHFILKTVFSIEYTIFLMIPVFFLLLYYITIGRKKYLVLSEANQ